MLTLERRAELLAKASELAKARDRGALAELLTPLSRDDLLSEPELGFHLALAWRWGDRNSDAWELSMELSEPCRHRGYDQLYRRRLNLEAGLLVDFGELSAAEAAYLEVFQRSLSAGDQLWVALATRNLGALAGICGDWAKALTYTQRALTALQNVGDIYNLAGAHQNLGMIYQQVGLLDRADKHFEQSLELYGKAGFDTGDWLSVEIERALTINAMGDYRRAEATVRRVLQRISTFEVDGDDLTRGRGEALRVLGVILLGRRRLLEARETLVRALEYAVDAQVPLLEGELYEALSRVAAAEGNYAESSNWIAEAVRIFVKMGAKLRAERIASTARMTMVG